MNLNNLKNKPLSDYKNSFIINLSIKSPNYLFNISIILAIIGILFILIFILKNTSRKEEFEQTTLSRFDEVQSSTDKNSEDYSKIKFKIHTYLKHVKKEELLLEILSHLQKDSYDEIVASQHTNKAILPHKEEMLYTTIDKNINAIIVVFETIPPSKKISQSDSAQHRSKTQVEEHELNFLPFVIDNEKPIVDKSDTDRKKIYTLNFDNEEIPIGFIPHVIEENEEIKEIDYTELNVIYEIITKNNTQKTSKKETTIYTGDNNKTRVTKPIFGKIAADEKANNRIQYLFKKNGGQNKSEKNTNQHLKPFSVFEDLFRNCDTEAKLILLDQIIAVGDEKEIPFLCDLLDDSNLEISLKASKLLRELQNKLMLQNITPKQKIKRLSQKSVSNEYSSLMNTLNIKPAKEHDDIFDIAFEFTEEIAYQNNSEIKMLEKQTSLFNYIRKIIGIKEG